MLCWDGLASSRGVGWPRLPSRRTCGQSVFFLRSEESCPLFCTSGWPGRVGDSSAVFGRMQAPPRLLPYLALAGAAAFAWWASVGSVVTCTLGTPFSGPVGFLLTPLPMGREGSGQRRWHVGSWGQAGAWAGMGKGARDGQLASGLLREVQLMGRTGHHPL